METYVNPKFKKDYLCKRLDLYKIKSAFYFDDPNNERFYKITVLKTQNDNFKLDVWLSLS